MFGLFKNKKDATPKEEKPKAEHPEYLALVDKWNVFLEKMNTRFEASIVHAEEAVLENLVESNFDILPTTRAWHSMKSQLMGMITKIDETFDEKVKPQMQAYKEDWDLLEEDKKGTILRESIYERIERHERRIEGKVAQKFYNHAIQFLNEDFNCTQCHAKLEVRKDIFRSHYVSCDYCNTVNTFTPNSKVAEISSFAVDNIAKYNAMAAWDNYKKAQNEFHKIRPPAQGEDQTAYKEGYKKREETEREYWTKYFTERAVFLPENATTIEHDVAVKMTDFYKERKREINF